MDTQRVALWHAISDTQMENWELQLQITEERHARLGLAEIVASMRRGLKPREDLWMDKISVGEHSYPCVDVL
ncbi:hypothetical protein Tco_0821305 [Tanacetum coccineum]|uniref:Uncharacterized protein n=1 Tax=Tanacetum coccineum TaxID=301880 RepID=A0ABQ5AG33_9ASTR